MKQYLADLHIHTCLSPCGSLEMSPSEIVRHSLAKGLDAIAITDHNTTLQCPEIQSLGERFGLRVFAGVEVTTREEAHCLVYFPTDESRKRFQRYLEEHLPPIPNDPERFGDQVWVNAENEILGEVPYLLLSALDQSVNQIAAQARKVDALFVAAHVERPSFSLISQLGFIDPCLSLDAIYYNKQYRIYSDSIYVLTHTYDLAELQARYDHERLLNIANSLQMEKLQILKIALLLIICLLIIILFYQIYIFKKERLLVSIKEKINVYEEKIKENELLIEKNNARIDSLTLEQSKVVELNKINEDLKKQNRLLHEQIEKGKQSLSSYFVKLGDQVPYFYRLKRIRSCPHFLKEEDWSVIRIWVNLQYNQYADRLEKDFPEFTELDMQYCWLIKMGFTTSEIATCMAINSASSTKQKQRIKQRIKKSALVSQKDDFSLDQFIKEY